MIVYVPAVAALSTGRYSTGEVAISFGQTIVGA